MAFPLGVIAAAFLGQKLAGGGAAQQPGFQLPTFTRSKAVSTLDPNAILGLRVTPPQFAEPLGIPSGGAPDPSKPVETGPSTKSKIMDAFLQSMVQRIFLGGGQPAQTYTPPTFR